MRKGDTLILWKLDRLGCSLPQLEEKGSSSYGCCLAVAEVLSMSSS